MAYDRLDHRQLHVQPLAARKSKHHLDEIRRDPDATPPDPGAMAPAIAATVAAIRAARASGAAVILAYGAHLVKNGLGPVVARLVQEGWITHLATNGAGTIHDWEYAYGGRSEEDVRAHVAAGCFGTWDETGRYIHLAALAAALTAWAAAPSDDPLMPARAELLQAMRRSNLPAGWHRVAHPHHDFSLTAAAYRARAPLTVHPGIGYDIIANHPAANGAALGRAAYLDYQTFAHGVSQLDGGVLLSVGSAIMAPQVFEKALSFANNLRRQQGLGPIRPFIVVNDLATIDWDWSTGEPPMDNPAYYLRFCKSFSRMGGEMVYAGGDNAILLTNLQAALAGA